jgi:hypothetical protein
VLLFVNDLIYNWRMQMSTDLLNRKLTKTPLWVFVLLLCLFSLSVFADVQHEYSSQHLSQQSCEYSHHVKPFADTASFSELAVEVPCTCHIISRTISALLIQLIPTYAIRAPPRNIYPIKNTIFI